MKGLKERDIQRAIYDYCLLRRHVVVRFNNIPIEKDGRKIPVRRKGVSDLLVCLKPSGQFAAIEVKRPGEEPTPEQAEFLAEVERAGELALVARSIDDVRARGI